MKTRVWNLVFETSFKSRETFSVTYSYYFFFNGVSSNVYPESLVDQVETVKRLLFGLNISLSNRTGTSASVSHRLDPDLRSKGRRNLWTPINLVWHFCPKRSSRKRWLCECPIVIRMSFPRENVQGCSKTPKYPMCVLLRLFSLRSLGWLNWLSTPCLTFSFLSTVNIYRTY